MKKALKNKKYIGGFTLIELMIAIAIIVILSTIIITALNSGRAKGRDAKRIRNIEEIRKAIELYIATNNVAPDLGDPACINPDVFDNSCYTNEFDGGYGKPWATFSAQLNPYMKTIPKDPCGVGCYNPSGNYKYEGFFDYTYHAPAQLVPLNNPPDVVVTSSSYKIFAENMETGNPRAFGYGIGSF